MTRIIAVVALVAGLPLASAFSSDVPAPVAQAALAIPSLSKIEIGPHIAASTRASWHGVQFREVKPMGRNITALQAIADAHAFPHRAGAYVAAVRFARILNPRFSGASRYIWLVVFDHDFPAAQSCPTIGCASGTTSTYWRDVAVIDAITGDPLEELRVAEP
jgi:hypothetical protein